MSFLPFRVSDGVAELITAVEQAAGTEILLREDDFNRFDEPASVRGGFDNWVPHITVNRGRRDRFDEHGLAHELLHIKRFLEGAPSLETPETVAGIRTKDAEIRKAFASDVTNQIEHVAIFPQLRKIGFDPDSLADDWKCRQIHSLANDKPEKFGPVEKAWLCIKIGVSGFLGRSTEIQHEYRSALSRVMPGAILTGDKIAQLILRFGVEKKYNLKRLYQAMLRTAGVPKRALLLKHFNFKTHTEWREPIP